MGVLIFIGFLLFSSLILISFIRHLIKDNMKDVKFIEGMIPSHTGRYYIILNNNGKKTITVDTYNAESMQWKNTKNPLMITHYLGYWELS